MTDRKLYASIPGFSNLLSVNVATQHEQSVSTATIECIGTPTKGIGDEVNIDLGFTDYHGHIFKGYIKQIEKTAPPNIYKVTCHDVLAQAVDYFFVPTNPDQPFRRQNIKAEKLIEDVLREAGLTNFDFDDTHFTFAVTPDVYAEVKLISAYDYCNGITDILAWHFWADENGIIKLKNRKPYFMASDDPGTSQPGWVNDIPIKTLTDTNFLNVNYVRHERDLRNRVVVVGAPGVSAEASASSPYLPAGFYKTAALYWPILDSQEMADKAATYNLNLLNRLSIELQGNVIGDYQLLAHKAVSVNISKMGISDDFYIFYAEHNWSEAGYITTLQLRAKAI